jgi:uncharacterized protein (TIGR02246 family)
MRAPRTIWCVLLTTLALACNPAADAPLSLQERQAIADTVQTLFSGIAEATDDLDLDRLLGYYRESDDLTYVANGRINRSHATFREMVNTQFGGLSDSQLEFANTHVDVLSREVAVVTANFEYTATIPSGRAVSSAGTFTCIYVLSEGRWQIQHSSHTFPPATG